MKKREIISNNNIKQTQAVIVATTSDDPAKVVEVAIALRDNTDFDLTIAGCAIRSFSHLPFGAPVTGLSMPGFAAEQYIKYGHGEIQELCKKIIKALDEALPKDTKPEVSCIDGRSRQIVSTLASMFEIVIVPHYLKLPKKFRLRGPVLDTLLMKSKKVPTLFCVDCSICKRIVVAQVATGIGLQTEQILRCLADSFSAPVYQWFPVKSLGINWLQPEAQKGKLAGIPESFEVDEDSVFTNQVGTLLVVPGAVILSFLRFRSIRLLLSNWKGNFLILP